MKRQVPLLICGIAGAFMAVQYFIPACLPIYDRINDYMQIVRAFAIILGLASVIQRHYGRVRRSGPENKRHPDWVYSLAALVGLGVMLLAGAIGGREQGTLFQNLFNAIPAVIVMIGRLDDGGALKLPEIARMILNGPNLVAKRAIILGVGLGMASTALKVVMGIERSYLGSGKE